MSKPNYFKPKTTFNRDVIKENMFIKVTKPSDPFWTGKGIIKTVFEDKIKYIAATGTEQYVYVSDVEDGNYDFEVSNDLPVVGEIVQSWDYDEDLETLLIDTDKKVEHIMVNKTPFYSSTGNNFVSNYIKSVSTVKNKAIVDEKPCMDIDIQLNDKYLLQFYKDQWDALSCVYSR